MAKNEKTSPNVAKLAGQKLSNPNTPKDVKCLAASVLAQAPDKPKKKS